jgi:hypothetical protein
MDAASQGPIPEFPSVDEHKLVQTRQLSGSPQMLDLTKIPPPQLEALIDLACHAA